jgi:hypothetical protein
MVFYEESGIQIPQSLSDYQCKAVSNKAVLVAEYIEDNLETWHGMKLLERHIYALRYTHGLGWRMHCGAEVTESSTNKQHHLSPISRRSPEPTLSFQMRLPFTSC